ARRPRGFAGARVGGLQRGAEPLAQLALGVAPGGRRRHLRGNHPVRRDARLREEGAVERGVLRRAVLGRAAVAEGAARQRRAAAVDADRSSLTAPPWPTPAGS